MSDLALSPSELVDTINIIANGEAHGDLNDWLYPEDAAALQRLIVEMHDAHAETEERIGRLEKALEVCRQGYDNQIEFAIIPTRYFPGNYEIIAQIDEALR